jgi:branched-chain amino acid transport system permease protein
VAGVAFAHWIAVVNPNAAHFPLSVKFLLMACSAGCHRLRRHHRAFAVEGLDEGLRDINSPAGAGASARCSCSAFGLVLTADHDLPAGRLHQLWPTVTGRRRTARRASGAGPDRDGRGPVPLRGRGPWAARREAAPPARPADVLLEAGAHQALRRRGRRRRRRPHVAAGRDPRVDRPQRRGKTTVFNMVSGVIAPSAGRSRGRARIEGRKPHVFAAGRATRTFQNLQIFSSMTVVENVMVGRHLRGKAGMGRAMLALPAVREEREMERSARELVDLLGLGDDADRLAADLPFGRQRLVEVARALATDPDLLLLDEPMAGLSGGERRTLAGLLRRLRAGGIAVVLVEHDVEAVMALADRVAVLDDGVLIALGPPDTVRHDPAVVAAYLGVEEDDEVAVELATGDPTAPGSLR